MNVRQSDKFLNMLENESSFDRIFCDVFETKLFKMFYNSHFSDDTLFNHSVISKEILDSENNDTSSHSEIFEEIKVEARKRKVPPSIFVEGFWRNSQSILKSAIDSGYIISGGMELHSKQIERNPAAAGLAFDVGETENVKLWNEVFMRSFNINESWKEELLNREKKFQRGTSTHLLLATEKNDRSSIVGCILLHRVPRDWMGVYCVGTVPEKRHRGVAKGMMYSAEIYAGEVGCKYLTLQTITIDRVAPMYLKLGFKIDFSRDVLSSP